MPDNNELISILRAVIQEELTAVRQEMQELRLGQERLETKVDKLEQGQEKLETKVGELELRMKNEVIEKIRALYDGFNLRGDQFENLQKRLDQSLDSIEIDIGYLVSKVAQLEKMAK